MLFQGWCFVNGGYNVLLQSVCYSNTSHIICILCQKKPEDDQPKLSKKKLRKMNRLSVAELKQVCIALFILSCSKGHLVNVIETERLVNFVCYIMEEK